MSKPQTFCTIWCRMTHVLILKENHLKIVDKTAYILSDF